MPWWAWLIISIVGFWSLVAVFFGAFFKSFFSTLRKEL
jgi:hypothetical protein